MIVVTLLAILARSAYQNSIRTNFSPSLVCTPYPEPACTPNARGPRIAFSSDRACANWFTGEIISSPDDIYVMNADGTCATQLTFTWYNAIRPRWSPDGTRLLFETEPWIGDSSIEVGDSNFLYVMNADGSKIKRLADSKSCSLRASWSPDSSLVTFLSDNDDSDCTLYLVRADGAQKRSLVDIPLEDWLSDFGWSPDGAQIAFSAADPATGQREVFTVNVDGNELTNLTNHYAEDDFVAWTPDGNQMLFVSDRDIKLVDDWGRPKYQERPLYIMNTDGTNVQRLADNMTYTPDQMTWLPSSNSQIIVMLGSDWHIVDVECALANSTKPGTVPQECHTQLPDPTKEPKMFFIEASSEEQLLYGALTEYDTGTMEIYTVNLDGTGLVNLTNCPANDIDPDWSP